MTLAIGTMAERAPSQGERTSWQGSVDECAAALRLLYAHGKLVCPPQPQDQADVERIVHLTLGLVNIFALIS